MWTSWWKRLNYDLHSVLGFYASWYLLVIAITGIIATFPIVEKNIFLITKSPPPPWENPPFSEKSYNRNGIALDLALQKAQQAIPAAVSTDVILPRTSQEPIQFIKRVPHALNRNAESFVYVDQYSGKILRVDLYEKFSLGATIHALISPLHIGQIFGLPTQILALLASALLPFSAVSGVILWWNRRRQK